MGMFSHGKMERGNTAVGMFSHGKIDREVTQQWECSVILR